MRARWSREDIATRARLVDRVKEIVGGELMPSALSFCTAFDAVSTVIPGAVSEAQLLANIQAIQEPMPVEKRAQLEAFFEDEVRALQLPW